MLKETRIVNEKDGSHIVDIRFHDVDCITPLYDTVFPSQTLEGDYVFFIPEVGMIKADKEDSMIIKYERL